MLGVGGGSGTGVPSAYRVVLAAVAQPEDSGVGGLVVRRLRVVVVVEPG